MSQFAGTGAVSPTRGPGPRTAHALPPISGEGRLFGAGTAAGIVTPAHRPGPRGSR